MQIPVELGAPADQRLALFGGLGRGFHDLQRSAAQCVDFLGVVVACVCTHRRHLDQFAQLIDLAHLGGVDFAQNDAFLGNQLDNPLTLEPLQRLAHRRDGRAGGIADLALGDQPAGFERALHQAFHKPLIGARALDLGGLRGLFHNRGVHVTGHR